MSLSNFSATAQELASLTARPDEPIADVLDDKINDQKRFLKETGEGIGSTLGSHAGLKGIERLFKSDKAKGVLKKLGVEDGDIDGIVSKLKDKDFSGAISDITKGVSKKVGEGVEDAVKGLSPSDGEIPLSGLEAQINAMIPKGFKGALENAVPREINPFEVPEVASRINLPLNDSVKLSDILHAQAGGTVDRVKIPTEQFETFGSARPVGDITSPLDRIPVQSLKPAERVLADINPTKQAPKPYEVQNPSFNPNVKDASEPTAQPEETVKTGDVAVDEAVDKTAIQSSEKVVEESAEKRLARLAVESTVDDENPLGLAITGALGVGALVASLFSKDHKKKFVKPPTVNPSGTNYAVQLGVLD